MKGSGSATADGRDLLLGGTVARIATASSRPAPDGGTDAEVVLDRPVDPRAVATVELRGLALAQEVRSGSAAPWSTRSSGTRRATTRDDTAWLATRRGCTGCKLQVACEDCTSVRLAGKAYRRGRVTIAVQAIGRAEQTALNPSRRRVLVTDDGGLSELPAWIDGSGGSAVITVAADMLAAVRYGRRRADGLQHRHPGPGRGARPRHLDHHLGGPLMRAWCPRCDAVRPGQTVCPVCQTSLATLDDTAPGDQQPGLAPPDPAPAPPTPPPRLRIALAAATLVVAGLAFVAGRSIASPAPRRPPRPRRPRPPPPSRAPTSASSAGRPGPAA